MDNTKIAIILGTFVLVLGIIASAFFIPSANKNLEIGFTVKNPVLSDVEFTGEPTHEFIDGTLLSLPSSIPNPVDIDLPFVKSGNLKVVAKIGAYEGTSYLDSITLGESTTNTVIIKNVPAYSSSATLYLYENDELKDTMVVEL